MNVGPPTRMRPSRLGAALVAVLLLGSGCALLPRRGPKPDAPPPAPVPAKDAAPRDFRVVVSSEGALNPHCDYRLEVAPDGTVTYDVHHRGTRPSDRRGKVPLGEGGMEALWNSVDAGGFFALPDRFQPRPDGMERGIVTFTVTANGKSATVVADRAGQRTLDQMLRVLFSYLPRGVFQPPTE